MLSIVLILSYETLKKSLHKKWKKKVLLGRKNSFWPLCGLLFGLVLQETTIETETHFSK